MIRARHLVNGKIITISLLWLAVWTITQGLFIKPSLVSFLKLEANALYLALTLYVLLFIVLSFFVFKRINKHVFTRSKLLFLYAIPLIAAAAVPFHYHLVLAIPVFIIMIPISTFWQDYLTFGLYESAITTHVGRTVTIIVTGALFMVGHLVFFFDQLTLGSVYLWVLLLGIGLLFAYIGMKTRTIYLVNVLHLTFLLVFV